MAGWKTQPEEAQESCSTSAQEEIEMTIPYSDAELNLPERWFTGEEWGNGTAQKTYREDYKKAVELKDLRFMPFKERIFAFYTWRWKQECPWDGSEAGNLARLLKACPKLDVDSFSRWLYNYGISQDIPPGERPRKFLPRIHDYSITPLDRFRRDPNAENGKTFAARDEAATDTARERARENRRRTLTDGDQGTRSLDGTNVRDVAPRPRCLPPRRD